MTRCNGAIDSSAAAHDASACLQTSAADAREVPDVIMQLQDLQDTARQETAALGDQMRGMQQNLAPSLWQCVEEQHAACFGCKHVQAPQLQPIGQAAAVERMQVLR